MQDTITMIQTVGFPIVCCIGLGFYLKVLTENQRADAKEDKERLYLNLEKLNESNAEVVATNRMLVEHMQHDIKNIEVKVDRLVDTVKER